MRINQLKEELKTSSDITAENALFLADDMEFLENKSSSDWYQKYHAKYYKIKKEKYLELAALLDMKKDF